MTITRTFGTKFIPSYVAGTIIEVIHFRDMTFVSNEMAAIYLDTANASMDLGSFNIAKFPEFEGDESGTEKVLLLNKSESQSNKIGLKILKRKNNTGTWDECAEIILVNRGRKDYLDLRSYTGYPTRIMEKNDAVALQLVDYGDGLLWDTDFISIDFGCTVEITKKEIPKIRNALVPSILVVSTSALTFAANANRASLTIYNAGTTPIFIREGTTVSVSNYNFPLPAGMIWESQSDYNYLGTISLIRQDGIGNVIISESTIIP